jgi:ferrochelatase
VSERAVLLVGFGGPESLEEVPPFVESVLGRTPPAHVTEHAVERYRLIGGGSPLPAMTRRQAELVGEELKRRGEDLEVYVGMLHADPTIESAADQMVADGVRDVTVVSLAPYRCEVSTDAYEVAARSALEGRVETLRFTPDWNLAPRYVEGLVEMLSDALRRAPEGTPVVFAAHSLPQRMIDQGDPYVDQLTATAKEVASRLGLADWHIGYQSVSAAAREPWLGPAVEELMDELKARGETAVLVDPIGFIADHVETLYDNDVEHREHADQIGIDFYRCRCLDDHPALIDALCDVVVDALAGV